MLTTAQLAKLPPGPPVHVPVEGVGWDINALPNERTDVEGRVLPAPIDDAGNMEDQTSPPLRAYDAPEVVALRERLAEHNGITGLEIFSPDDDPVDIVRVYRRDGFVRGSALCSAGSAPSGAPSVARATHSHMFSAPRSWSGTA